MKDASEFGYPLYDVMKELFSRVGQDIDTFDFSIYQTQDDLPDSDKPVLCDQFEWTQEEQDEFKEWFVDFFYSSAKARRKAECYIPKKKAYIQNKVWPWFMLDFAWRTKKEEETS